MKSVFVLLSCLNLRKLFNLSIVGIVLIKQVETLQDCYITISWSRIVRSETLMALDFIAGSCGG